MDSAFSGGDHGGLIGGCPPDGGDERGWIDIDRAAQESLQQQIRRQVGIAVVNHRFPMHDRLPSIRSLAGELGVSITTVKQAYDRLKEDGLIWTQQRLGHFVDPAAVTRPGSAPRVVWHPETGEWRRRVD